MKQLWLLFPLTLLASYTQAQTAFSYDSIQLGYYQGQVHLGDFDEYVSTDALTLRYSKSLGSQFYGLARAGHAQLKETLHIPPVQANFDARINELLIGVGRYFTLAPVADAYLQGTLSHSRAKVDIQMLAYGISQRQHSKENIAQASAELGMRLYIDSAQRFEIAPYYLAQRDEQDNSSQALGLNLGVKLSPRLELRGGLERTLNVEHQARGWGISLRAQL